MSRAIFLPLLAGFALALFTLLGCSQSPPASKAPSAAVEQPAEKAKPVAASVMEIVRIDAAELTVGDYLPPLDGGRIEVAPPSGWRPMPRDSEYLVRFYKQDRNSLPRLNVTVEEGAVGGISDATAENIAEIALALGEELIAKETALLEPVVPMVIGTVPCARYVSNLNLKLATNTILAERQTLVVVRGGRRYVIDVLVLPNRLRQGKDAAYAVCAGLRFPEANTSLQPAVTPELPTTQ
jgi:hypothetical protein